MKYSGGLIFILCVMVMVISFGGLVVSTFLTLTNRVNAMNEATNNLTNHFQIAQAELHSPSIIEITCSFDAFTQFCHEHRITKVYKLSDYGFVVVINETYGLEYIPDYHASIWWIW